MCPNCDANIKIDADSQTAFCAKCGIQLQSQDAFVYYELKKGGEPDVGNIGSYKLLIKCGTEFLEQGKHDLADACFANILKNAPDDYQVWKLRALTLESRVVNEHHASFYEYNKDGGLKENKAYIDKYRELCGNAVRHCPAESAEALAEEFNDRIRAHFNIAYRAYKQERRRTLKFVVLASSALLLLSALALNSCRM